jgi:hypothetical protein
MGVRGREPRYDAKGRLLCGAPKRQGEGFCTQKAGWGTPHVGNGSCKLHGGCMPNNVKAGQKANAEVELRRLGRPKTGDIDAQTELLSMVAEASGNVMTLRDRVRELDEDISGPTFHASGKETGHHEENILVVMYREWCDRLVAYSSAAIRAGISERAVKVMEEQAELCARVVLAVLDDPELGLTWDQRDAGRRIAGGHLRALPTVA